MVREQTKHIDNCVVIFIRTPRNFYKFWENNSHISIKILASFYFCIFFYSLKSQLYKLQYTVIFRKQF